MAKEKKSETVSAKIPTPVKKKLDKLAKIQDRKLSYIICQILTDHVN